MENQITLNNLLPLAHFIELGRKGSVSYYQMNEQNLRDRPFFENVKEIGIELGVTMTFQRGDLCIKIRCIKLEAQECYWRKIR
ncbi:hypothetical protein JR334_07055 [Clostridia bacterium]|nr:hypothetical protein JR334_07055 [Clostridia bacterium]